MSIAQDLRAPSWVRPRGVHVDLASHGHAKVAHTLAGWERRHLALSVVFDVVAAVIGVAVGLLALEATLGAAPVAPHVVAVAVVMAGWPVTLAAHGGYASRFVGAGNEQYRAVTRAAVSLTAIGACTAFFLGAPVSSAALPASVVVALLLSGVSRWSLRRRLAFARVAGAHLRPTLLVGDPRFVQDMAEQISRERGSVGMEVVGACVTDLLDPGVLDLQRSGVRVFGSQDRVLDAVEATGAAVVAVATNPQLAGAPLRRLGWSLEQRDVDLLIAPGIIEVAGPRLSLRPAAGLPLLHVERPVMSGARYAVKLLLDRVGAIALLALAAPVLAVIAALIRADSRGPVFFLQERVGEGGRTFRMVKFRTMVVDAEARLAELAAANDGNGTLFKLHHDPRITRVGAVLRRFSLDELPQLFNVALGQMSLVGPRPPLTREVDAYESDVVRRLRVRPGMTGLWQVSGRSDLSWDDSVRLDLWYVDNWSLAMDAQILMRTAEAVVRGRGAY